MPYVITPNRVHPGDRATSACLEPVDEPHKVATLEEAKNVCIEIAADAGAAGAYSATLAEIHNLSESGGTVGPLPDGTMIEVVPIEWAEWSARIWPARKRYVSVIPNREYVTQVDIDRGVQLAKEHGWH